MEQELTNNVAISNIDINLKFIGAINNDKRDNSKLIAQLLKQGADLHFESDYALRWKSAYGHINSVKLLLSNGADVHAAKDGALRLAIKNGHVDVVKLLLRHGARLDKKMIQLSIDNNHDKLTKLLSKIINK